MLTTYIMYIQQSDLKSTADDLKFTSKIAGTNYIV